MLCWLQRSLLPGLLAVLVGTVPAGARADDWPVARGPSREPTPYRYDPAQWKQVPKAFLEDTAACILYSGTTHLIEADGTVETVTHEITRLNGRKGVEGLGEYHSITYDPAYQKLTLNEARVLKADGRVVRIQPKHLQLRDAGTDYQVYDQDKQLVISFPNLEVGDVFEVKWTTRGKSPEFDGQFFARYTFGDGQYPTVRDELKFRLPKNKVLRFAPVNGKIEPAVREEGEHRLYHWTALNLPELPQDSELPSKEELRLQVMCSTYASWEEVAQWKQKLRADCWECTPEVRKLVAELTRGLKDPEDKARALAYWVRQRIRYISMASAHHGYTPHPPAQVLANLYGDCKDQGQLLAVMLREAGLPVYLVTLGAQDDGQIVPEVPSPWGTHAILLVRIDGRDHWIDTTSTMSAWDFLPRSDRDRAVYVTGDDGLKLMRTPPMTCADNRFEQVTQISVRSDGTSQCRRTVSYHGQAALNQRDAWIDVPAGERRRLMTAELQDANSRTRLRGLHIDEKTLQDLDRPVRARVEFDIPEHFSGDPEYEGSLTDSKVWNRLLSYTLDYERKVALDLGSPFESIHRYEVRLPPAYRFGTPPKDQELYSKWGFFRIEVRPDSQDPRQVAVEFHTRLEKMRIEPADFAAFRKFHQDVYKQWRVWLSYNPTTSLADALALEATLACNPGDLSSATVLAKLYVHHDRLKEARRVLRQAQLYHPRDAGLWDLTVNAAENLEEEENACRAMVRRFPDEPKHAVALATTCINRGRYAEAREVLEPLTRQGSATTRAQASFQLARCARLQKQPAAALKHLEAARAADPDSVKNVDALRLEAQAHEQLGQVKEAVEAYHKALAESGEDRDLLAAVIRLELASEDRVAVLDQLRRYTLLVKDDLEGLVQAANFHLQMGRYEDALELALRAHDRDFHTGTQRVLGLVYLQRGDYARAVSHLERAQPDAQVVLGLIRSQLALGKLDQALAQAKSLSALANGSAELRQAQSLLEALAQRRREVRKTIPDAATPVDAFTAAVDTLVCAEQAYNEGVPADRVLALLTPLFSAGVEIGPAYGLRGLVALERGRLSQALADAKRAIALSPGEARGYYVRGRVRLERGQKDALADLARAAELSQQKDALLLHWLASAQFEQGRHQEALATQRRAVELRPQDRELAEQLHEFERVRNANADPRGE